MYWQRRALAPNLMATFLNRCTLNSRFYASKIQPGKPRGPPLPKLDEAPAPSMLHYFYNVQQKYPDAIVLAQVGSFMELYFSQALEIGPLLKLKVARKPQRNPITGESFVHMAGFPLSKKEVYEAEIVKNLDRSVVMLMQDSRFVTEGGTEEEKRPITRILTPGTLLDESLVNQDTNNYLAAISTASSGGKKAVVIYVDIASGKVKYQIVEQADLGNTLASISPLEVLIDPRSSMRQAFIDAVEQYSPHTVVTKYHFPHPELWTVQADKRNTFELQNLDKMIQKSYVALWSYISQCMPGSEIDLGMPQKLDVRDTMQIDAQARTALEINVTPNGTKGSLISCIKRTKSISGSRLLQEWLAAPLQDPKEIQDRQDKVQFFLNQTRVPLLTLATLLSELPDGHRNLQKLRFGRNDPRELLTFAQSTKTVEEIAAVVSQMQKVPSQWKSRLSSLVSGPSKTATEILRVLDQSALELSAADPTESEVEMAADEEKAGASSSSKRGTSSASGGSNTYSSAAAANGDAGLNSSRQKQRLAASGFQQALKRDYKPVLFPSASPKLLELYEKQHDLLEQEQQLLQKLQQVHGPSTSLRWSPSYQFHVHVISNGKNKFDTSFLLSTKNKNIYLANGEWRLLGQSLLELNETLRKEEELILSGFRNAILTDHLTSLRELYALVDEIDVLMSFAALATEKWLVRPKIVKSAKKFDIKGGRNIAVETGLALNALSSTGFVANDCNLSRPKHVCMVTGPNMGGKSTYLRQNAIIALLAHVGCFVPASEATIGVVDRIFCRIGSGDDLYMGRSTFLMEMLELSNILNNATEHSLAIIDEVGRGTSSKDGLAIAFASLKHLASRSHCRTLFATHYGAEIWQALANSAPTDKTTMSRISLLKADLQINQHGEPTFDYKLTPGITSSSCGLLIAEMAGIPSDALHDAKQFILSNRGHGEALHHT